MYEGQRVLREHNGVHVTNIRQVSMAYFVIDLLRNELGCVPKCFYSWINCDTSIIV